MDVTVRALISKLSGGSKSSIPQNHRSGIIETLAKAYERARNSLEYRADNLVRRAAIERMLKRLIVIYKNPDEIAENLYAELSWARYLDLNEANNFKKIDLATILKKYISYKGVIPREWIIKIASSEIEEFLNLNKDYLQFTYFAFQVLKQKIKISDTNLDLLIYYSVDKIYAESDPEQIAYHIISLAGSDIDHTKLEEGWRLFNLASKNEEIPRINKFVRNQMPPLVLLRDMYFYSPKDFIYSVNDSQKTSVLASKVLDNQLGQMSGKVTTAGIRSVLYVFLTKMILAFGVEVPLETLIYGKISILPLFTNLLFPPFLMWLTTMQIKLPDNDQKEKLINRSAYIMTNFKDLKNEDDYLDKKHIANKPELNSIVFTSLYTIIFIAIFVFLYYILGLLGFTFFSKLIFVFFLTIIAFFAYRINQVANVYSWKERVVKTSLLDMFYLPIITTGSLLSKSLSKLNFIGFVFDFLLEAPFKIILGFLDDWVHFLSIKKEEQILE